MKQQDRRSFLGTLGGLAGMATLADPLVAFPRTMPDHHRHIACNVYTWFTFYRREGRDWGADLDASLATFVRSGLTGYEPSLTSPEQATQLGPLLKKHKLEMRSLYVNSTLHDAETAEKSIADVLAIAEAAQPLGAKIIVTNPSPIRWGGPESKTDAQLHIQAANLNRLGAELHRRGLTLAYHNHDIELKHAAREFHHMMQATNPEHVTFCLDTHWVFRGSGDSQVALFDVIKMYGNRVTELHLRQSKDGIWTEAFGPGDIDYPAVAAALLEQDVLPYLVLEQSIEEGSPNTMKAVEAHQKGLAYTKKVFADFL